MLMLTARIGERIRLRYGTKTMWLTVTNIGDRKARLAIDAPPEVLVLREELIDKVRERVGTATKP